MDNEDGKLPASLQKMKLNEMHPEPVQDDHAFEEESKENSLAGKLIKQDSERKQQEDLAEAQLAAEALIQE